MKDKPLVVAGGAILCGASLEEGYWRAFVDISTDDGVTFNATPPLEVQGGCAGIIQPTLFETAAGKGPHSRCSSLRPSRCVWRE